MFASGVITGNYPYLKSGSGSIMTEAPAVSSACLPFYTISPPRLMGFGNASSLIRACGALTLVEIDITISLINASGLVFME